MLMRRRRPLLRAAVVGGVAYHAGKQRTGREQQGSADERLGQQQPDEPPQPAPTSPASQDAGSDMVAQLTKLKELMDAGALTQDEFDAAKRKLLGGA